MKKYFLFLLIVCLLPAAWLFAQQPIPIGPFGVSTPLVQRTTTTTNSSGNFTVTWNQSFVSSIPDITVVPLNTSGIPIICNVTARSQTSASGTCWEIQSQAVALISLTISLAPSAPPVSTTLMVIGADPSQ
jgi:hypothetical protein